jgi:ParB/RepB/Spo0J family partition protein
MAEQTTFGHIDLSKIYEPDESLRRVNRESEEYMGLVESIRSSGILNPITVREIQGDNGEIDYGLVDGLQRYNGAKDAGLSTIPSHIIKLEDANLLEAQIIANVHKIETRPVEYSRALVKILVHNPLLTKTELATKLSKTTGWISERLGLLNLTEKIATLVDEGNIGLSNAYALAKLPPDEQEDFVDRAISMTPQQFGPTANARVKELRDAKRKGRSAEPAEFQPVAIIRSKAEMLAELENAPNAPKFCFNISDPVKGFLMGVRWCLQLDSESVEIQKAQDEERKAERAKAKEQAAVERKRKRAAEAAKKAAELQKEVSETT